MKDNIILTGYMGAGKTSTGVLLAHKTDQVFIDTDKRIETDTGRKISEIFESDGEEAFRAMETELLKKLLDEGFSGVISCGGGMPVREENRKLLKELGTVFYLKVRPETVAIRLSGDSSRPLLAGETEEGRLNKIRSMLDIRDPFYMSGADAVIPADDISNEEAAYEILTYMEMHRG